MNNEVEEALRYYNNKILFHKDFSDENFEKAGEFIIHKIKEDEYKDKDIALIIVTDNVEYGRKLCDQILDAHQFCTAEYYSSVSRNHFEVYCCSSKVKKYKISADIAINHDDYRYFEFRPLDKNDSDFYIFNSNENLDRSKLKGKPVLIGTNDDIVNPDVNIVVDKEHIESYLHFLDKFVSPRIITTMYDDEFIKDARGKLIFSGRYEYDTDEECLQKIEDDIVGRDLNGSTFTFLSEYNPMMLFRIGAVIGSRFPLMYISQCAASKIYGNKKKYVEILVFNK